MHRRFWISLWDNSVFRQYAFDTFDELDVVDTVILVVLNTPVGLERFVCIPHPPTVIQVISFVFFEILDFLVGFEDIIGVELGVLDENTVFDFKQGFWTCCGGGIDMYFVFVFFGGLVGFGHRLGFRFVVFGSRLFDSPADLALVVLVVSLVVALVCIHESVWVSCNGQPVPAVFHIVIHMYSLLFENIENRIAIHAFFGSDIHRDFPRFNVSTEHIE